MRLYHRLSECGLDDRQMMAIPPRIGAKVINGKGALLTIARPCPCPHCGGKDLEVILVPLEKIPAWLRTLLRSSVEKSKKGT